MKKRISIIAFLIFCLAISGYSQVNYSGKLESGFLMYQYRLVTIEAGSGWDEYNLEKGQNGIDINIINGINLKDSFFAGVGLGYLNYGGINGVSILSDFEYILSKKGLKPYFNFKVGYSHIWNQYENGTGSGLGELGFGIKSIIASKLFIYGQIGVSATQQASFIPIRIGVGF